MRRCVRQLLHAPPLRVWVGGEAGGYKVKEGGERGPAQVGGRGGRADPAASASAALLPGLGPDGSGEIVRVAARPGLGGQLGGGGDLDSGLEGGLDLSGRRGGARPGLLPEGGEHSLEEVGEVLAVAAPGRPQGQGGALGQVRE